MPEGYIIEEWMLEEMRAVLRRTYDDWTEHRCESTLTLLLIRLYEVGIAFYGYNFNQWHKANYGALTQNIESYCGIPFSSLRNNLVHNMERVHNFNLMVFVFMHASDPKYLDTIYEFCCDAYVNLHDDILTYLGNQITINKAGVLLDPLVSTNKIKLIDTLTEDVYNNLPTLIKGDASLKQLLPILEMSVKKLLRGEN